MKTIALLILAGLGIGTSSPVPASPDKREYLIAVRLLAEGKVLAAPSMTGTAGKTSTVAMANGANRWSVTVTPVPVPSATGKALTLATDVEIWNGQETRRRLTTTMLLNEGETVALKVEAQDALPAVDVEISATGL